MMIAIMAVYLVLLFALVRFGIVSFNLFWKSSPFIVLLLLNLGSVHSHGVGRAAGIGAGGAQRGRRSCPMLQVRWPRCRWPRTRR